MNCRASAKKFTPSASFQDTSASQNVTYVTASVSGDVGIDEVRVIQNMDKVEMKLIAVTSEENTAGTQSDGIVGLTPGATNGGDLLVSKLYDAKLIGNKTFGLDINPESEGNSKIIFGGYDTSIVGENPTFAYITLRSTADWRVTVNRIKYDNVTFYAKGGIGVFDCGTSVTTFQYGVYFSILTQICRGKVCFKVSSGDYINFYASACNSYDDFANITFQLGSYDFNWANSRYIKETTIDDQNVCVFMFNGKDFSDSADFILLGANFFYDYYVYHDMQNKRIGLYGDYTDAPDSAFSYTAFTAILSIIGVIFLIIE